MDNAYPGIFYMEKWDFISIDSVSMYLLNISAQVGTHASKIGGSKY
ncbi:hypothetical protein EMIT0180MI3_10297 [Priestia megaterium]